MKTDDFIEDVRALYEQYTDSTKYTIFKNRIYIYGDLVIFEYDVIKNAFQITLENGSLISSNDLGELLTEYLRIK